jgi:Zn-dependent M28 family amino/carboxypeptidase
MAKSSFATLGLLPILLHCGVSPKGATPIVLSDGGGTRVEGSTPTKADVEASRFRADLETASTARPPGSAHWQAVQDLCAARFQSLGYSVERHAYGSGVNIIGVRTGASVPDERVLVSAHYDGVPNCAAADDNATGVAALFEVARVLGAQPFAKTLALACWDEEERGLIGSQAYVTRAKATGERIVGSFVFETIGYRSTAPQSQRLAPGLDVLFPAQAAEIAKRDSRGDFIALIHDERAAASVEPFKLKATELGLPTVFLPVSNALKRSPAIGDLRRSDHAPFWDADFPAVQITDTAEFRNSHYHCRGGADVPADIDVPFAVAVTQATIAAATTLLQ